MLTSGADDKGSDEIGANLLKIDVKLADGKIASQKLFVDTPKRAKEVAHERPHPFDGINMDFTDTIPIVIARPLVLSMTD